jgi:hypothetical protein
MIGLLSNTYVHSVVFSFFGRNKRIKERFLLAFIFRIINNRVCESITSIRDRTNNRIEREEEEKKLT